MKDKYRIREAARLFGMSAEALRYYEREHIILPLRDAENEYRYYNKFSILRLNYCKRLRSMRFTMKEIKQIFLNESPELFVKRIDGKRKEIKSIIKWYKALDTYMTEYESILKRFPLELNVCSIKESPELYYILHYEDMWLLTENGSSCLYPLWLEKMPLVRIFSISPLESVLKSPPLTRKGGLAVLAEHAALCGIDTQRQGVHHIKPEKCVYTLIAVENTHESIHHRFNNVLEYIRNNNLSISGDPWAFQLFKKYRTLNISDHDAVDGKEGTVYYAYYIPVK
ncbi:MAG: MerR family transcriptional regulator [Spirochaetaceae bacterium]|nr:MerR family transcriptional regulator [Spirochaetaceae bacterium]